MTCFLYGVEMKVGIHTHTHTHTLGLSYGRCRGCNNEQDGQTDLMESGKADTEQAIQHLCLQ